MTLEQFEFEGDPADICVGKYSVMFMGGWVTGLECKNPHQCDRKLFLPLPFLFRKDVVNMLWLSSSSGWQLMDQSEQSRWIDDLLWLVELMNSHLPLADESLAGRPPSRHVRDVVPVARMDHFRALKCSDLDHFRALKWSRLDHFRALKSDVQIGVF